MTNGILPPLGIRRTYFLLGMGFLLAACASDAADSVDGGIQGNDAGASPDAAVVPLELTTDLCDDPSNMALLAGSLGQGNDVTFGEANEAQFMRMVQAPTEGPFYMVNLIRYRERARYADGRDSDLTGREADALYAPIEFITAIGARVVFSGEVPSDTPGNDETWEHVAIVEYPCPLAFFAMSAHPEFQARAIHKEAGVEKSIVMVTHPQALDDIEISDSPFPPTAEDPAFERVEVIRYRETAAYGPDVDEPTRSGRAAMDIYTSSVASVMQQLGIYPKVRLAVQGVVIGDERTWDEVRIDFVPSRAARDAFASNATVAAADFHREAAWSEAFLLPVAADISMLPGAPASDTMVPPVTADGTGTLCQQDGDCPGDGVDTCFSAGEPTGFCTREGCLGGDCQAPYVCCRACSDLVASMLPFDGSACLPSGLSAQLTAAPASCTCD
ncbi:MAG: hypothetical protein AAFN74_22345 [Myxococcota bacterium]